LESPFVKENSLGKILCERELLSFEVQGCQKYIIIENTKSKIVFFFNQSHFLQLLLLSQWINEILQN